MSKPGQPVRSFAERADDADHGFANGMDRAVEILDGIAELIASDLRGGDVHLVVTGNGGCGGVGEGPHRDNRHAGGGGAPQTGAPSRRPPAKGKNTTLPPRPAPPF